MLITVVLVILLKIYVAKIVRISEHSKFSSSKCREKFTFPLLRCEKIR